VSPVEAMTSSDIEVFRHQVRMIRKVIGANIDGVSHEESLVQPQPAGNCINWVFGHLVDVYDRALPLLGQESLMTAEQRARYARGAPALDDPAEAMEMDALRASWETIADRIDAGLAGLPAERMDDPAPFSPSGSATETVRSLISTILFHQTYHAGQLGVLRRIAGKEGKIK
jgi:uncharacterized damage-inducible protein DinB